MQYHVFDISFLLLVALVSFVRRCVYLVVVVHDGELRDSHFGTKELPRLDTTMNQDYGLAYEYNNKMAFNYVEIPINYTVWYYIVATYDPFVDVELSLSETDGYYNLNSTLVDRVLI